MFLSLESAMKVHPATDSDFPVCFIKGLSLALVDSYSISEFKWELLM